MKNLLKKLLGRSNSPDTPAQSEFVNRPGGGPDDPRIAELAALILLNAPEVRSANGDRLVEIGDTGAERAARRLIDLADRRDFKAGEVLAQLKAGANPAVILEFFKELRGRGPAVDNDLEEDIGNIALTLGDFDLAAVVAHEALRRNPDDFGALADLAQIHVLRLQGDEAIAVYERLIAIAEAGSHPETAAGAYANLGNAWMVKGDHRKAEQAYRRAHEIFHSVGRTEMEAAALGSLAHAYSEVGNFASAKTSLEAALEIHRRRGDLPWQARLYGDLAKACAALGERKAAADMASRRLALCEKLDDKRDLARACADLAGLQAALEKNESASDLLKRAISLLSTIGDEEPVPNLYCRLADIQRADGLTAAALNALGKALEGYTRLGMEAWRGVPLSCMASIHLEQGRTAEAEACYDKALEATLKAGSEKGRANFLRVVAEFKRKLGKTADAEALFAQAERTYTALEMPAEAADCLMIMSTLAEGRGDRAAARDLILGFIEIVERLGALGPAAMGYGNLGVAHRGLGEIEKAEECHLRSLAIASEIGDEYLMIVQNANLGGIRRDQERHGEAREFWSAALRLARKTGHRQMAEQLDGLISRLPK